VTSTFDFASLPGEFPHGMKWLATRYGIGFRPGIGLCHLVPAMRASTTSTEWFLHDPQGRPCELDWPIRTRSFPAGSPATYGRNSPHDVADWGYEFFKIDGMSGENGGYSAHFYERPEVRAASTSPARIPSPLDRGATPRNRARQNLPCLQGLTGRKWASVDAAAWEPIS